MTSSPIEGEADILGRVLNFHEGGRKMEAAVDNNLPDEVQAGRLPVVKAVWRSRQGTAKSAQEPGTSLSCGKRFLHPDLHEPDRRVRLKLADQIHVR